MIDFEMELDSEYVDQKEYEARMDERAKLIASRRREGMDTAVGLGIGKFEMRQIQNT